jgi:hypothetical protein
MPFAAVMNSFLWGVAKGFGIEYRPSGGIPAGDDPEFGE